MLVEETTEELLDRLESVIYILGDRFEIAELREVLTTVVNHALDDIEADRDYWGK